jgi:hypothetical protein
MSEYRPPEHIHGPQIRKALRPLAEDIQKESGASKVIITCTYELDKKTEKMSIKMTVSTDTCMERNNTEAPRPKGDKLTQDAEAGIQEILDSKPDEKGE